MDTSRIITLGLAGTVLVVVLVVLSRLLAPCTAQSLPLRGLGLAILVIAGIVALVVLAWPPSRRLLNPIAFLLGLVGIVGVVVPIDSAACRLCPEIRTIDEADVTYFFGPEPVTVRCEFVVRGRCAAHGEDTQLLHKEPGQSEWTHAPTGVSGHASDADSPADWSARVSLCGVTTGEREILVIAGGSPPSNGRIHDRVVAELCPSRVYRIRIAPMAEASKPPAIVEFYVGGPREHRRRLSSHHVIANVRHQGRLAEIDWDGDDAPGFEELPIAPGALHQLAHTYTTTGAKRIRFRVSDEDGVQEVRTAEIELLPQTKGE